MSKFGTMGAIGLGVVLMAVAVAFRQLILPSVYSTSQAGIVGFVAVIVGIVVVTATAARATTAGQGSAGVVRIAGATVPILYLMAAAVIWLASPVLPDVAAYGIHIVLIAVLAIGMIGIGALTGHAKASDEARDISFAGREAMMSSAQSAQRKLPGEASEAISGMLTKVIESITYADRNSCSDTVLIERAIVEGLDRLSLDPADEAADVASLSDIQRRLDERRDVLKAQK